MTVGAGAQINACLFVITTRRRGPRMAGDEAVGRVIRSLSLARDPNPGVRARRLPELADAFRGLASAGASLGPLPASLVDSVLPLVLNEARDATLPGRIRWAAWAAANALLPWSSAGTRTAHAVLTWHIRLEAPELKALFDELPSSQALSALMQVAVALQRSPAVAQIAPYAPALTERLAALLFTAASNAPAEQQVQQQTGGLFSAVFGRPEPRTAHTDATQTRDAFTVLSSVQVLTQEQCSHVAAFAVLPAWASHVLTASAHQSPASEADSALLAHASRVLDQSRGAALRNPELARAADVAAEVAVRAIAGAALRSPALASAAFPLGVRAWQCLTVPPASAPSPLPPAGLASALLQLLGLFLAHSEAATYDHEPAFRYYFAVYAPAHFAAPQVPPETMRFCATHRQRILTATNVFSAYFPTLLRLYAWQPRACYASLRLLLPCLINGDTVAELFHALLDLPLLAATLERAEAHTRAGRGDLQASGGEARLLYNHFLRAEAGVPVNFWHADTALPIISALAHDSTLSPRVLLVAHHTPDLLRLFFSVLLTHGGEQPLRQLLPSLIDRARHLFPMPDFRRALSGVLVDTLVQVLRRWPVLVVDFKETLCTLITHSARAADALSEELLGAVCQLLGDVASPRALGALCTAELLADLHDALELLAYERITLARLAHSSAAAETSARLLLLLVSALAKLAARSQLLASRVVLCLSKVVKEQEHLLPAVVRHAHECIQLLRFPSIAPAVLDPEGASPFLEAHHLDANSSLSFLLRSESAAKLHEFAHLYDG